jgi:hypothetical protein
MAAPTSIHRDAGSQKPNDLMQMRTAIGSTGDATGMQSALDGVTMLMDAQGKELFLNWLHGRVADTLLLDTPSWQAYMNDDASHRIGLQRKLQEIANAQRPKLGRTNGLVTTSEVFSTKGFPAFLGKPGGGYYRGYEHLHGANMDVGGMQVKKGLLKAKAGPTPFDYTVVFTDLELEFNDITDPAHSNLGDVTAAGFFRALAAKLGIGPPKEFNTTIRWRSDLEVTMSLGPDHMVDTNYRRV